MKVSSWLSSSAGDSPGLISFALVLTSLAQLSHAVNFTPAPAANLDLSELGRVGLIGDFDGISLYEYEGQSQDGFNTNGSQSVLAPYPNGGFATLQSADAGIQAMCSYVMKNGTMAGVVVGGNFTSLGNVETAGAALFNPNTSAVTPLSGLSGQVYALYCDADTETVYVGGSFKGGNSTNAIAWLDGWTNLPFKGLNGPVTSITKAPNGHIIFGGNFTGLGNETGPINPDQQIINISGANISAGFSEPSNIVCKTSSADSSGNTWLLEDNTAGFWQADFRYGFQPSKLRLWNTHSDGRGAKTFRFTASPLNGIMNFTYTDPATSQNASCSSECPLSDDKSVQYQDFHFVNTVGMNSFRIDISAWFGSGGGLDGIELFQDDIYAYAINEFNEPTCASLTAASKATNAGPWTVTPSHDSSSEYLSASLTTFDATTQVVFSPDIRQSGNYSVNIYTPGCKGDDTCSTRAEVNVTGTMSGANTFQTTIFQTNDFPKYDQIYFGYIEAATGSFRPSVTLAPVSGQSTSPQTLVAQRVGFTLISSDGGLNGLFEYDPTQAVVNSADFTNSSFDLAGVSMGTGSGVNALATSGTSVYVGGTFSANSNNNILAVSSSGTTGLDGDGLNGEVLTLFANGSTLYVGGQFTDTKSGGKSGLNNVATYDTSKNAWTAMATGVNGKVTNIVPFSMNITANKPETVIALTGEFTQILSTGSDTAAAVTGFAVWVPSQNNWLQNMNASTIAINGQLIAFADIPNGGTLFSGSLSSFQLSANGIAGLGSGLNTFPVRIQPTQTQTQTTLSKRATGNTNISGVVTGLFYNNGGVNVTVLGGHFTAKGTDGSNITNLLFINGSKSDAVTGVGSSLSETSSILALDVEGTDLYAGGSLSGTVNGASVNGLISYNLATSSFNVQPPSLSGGTTTVNAISTRPKASDVYVGGDFSSAGSLDCPALCVYTSEQWNRPGTGLSGITNTMLWTSEKTLVVGGALTLNGANVSLATYDIKAQSWNASDPSGGFPGPVTALTAASSDASQLWAAGSATNGSAFLLKNDGKSWTAAGDVLGSGTVIKGLQVLSLTKKHDDTDLVPSKETLLLTGALVLPGFGNASAALFNGTKFQPFALTSSTSNTGGTLSQIFTEQSNFFKSGGKTHLHIPQ